MLHLHHRLYLDHRRLSVLGVTLLMLLGIATPALAQDSADAPVRSAYSKGDDLLPKDQFTLSSAIRVDLTKDFATLPLHKGTFEGKPA